MHLNGSRIDRGVCIEMNPSGSENIGYACLYRSNALYDDMTAVVMAAYMGERLNCVVWWNSVDTQNLGIVDTAGCN